MEVTCAPNFLNLLPRYTFHSVSHKRSFQVGLCSTLKPLKHKYFTVSLFPVLPISRRALFYVKVPKL
jgi:hypothetical protein